MSYKAEAGIRSSFTELTEARKIFDIGWDANMFYPTMLYKLKKPSGKRIRISFWNYLEDTRKWVDNWLSQRKDKLKNNSIYSGWLD